jgi:hypothetical protein
MGQDIELYKYDWNTLVDTLLSRGVEDHNKLEKILLFCGEKCGNTFYLLNNEAWEERNCFYLLSSVIDQCFDIEDSFDVFLELREYLEMSRDSYSFENEFGIDLDW